MLNITRSETMSHLWNLEDDEIAKLLDAFARLKIEAQGLRYVKRRWNEVRGDKYDDFGHSWWYFEIGVACNVIRQIERYDSGVILGYNSRMSRDDFGGLSTVPLDASLEGFEFTDAAEFNQLWEQRTNT